MKILKINMALLVLLSGCTTLRKETVNSAAKSESAGELKLSSHTVEQTAAELELKDSLHTGTTIRIWPKGTFSLSPDKGFWGEASRVDLQTETGQLTKLKQSTHVNKKTTTYSAARWQASAKQEGSSLKIIRWQTGWLCWLAGLSLLGFLLWKFRLKIF